MFSIQKPLGRSFGKIQRKKKNMDKCTLDFQKKHQMIFHGHNLHPKGIQCMDDFDGPDVQKIQHFYGAN